MYIGFLRNIGDCMYLVANSQCHKAESYHVQGLYRAISGYRSICGSGLRTCGLEIEVVRACRARDETPGLRMRI